MNHIFQRETHLCNILRTQNQTLLWLATNLLECELVPLGGVWSLPTASSGRSARMLVTSAIAGRLALTVGLHRRGGARNGRTKVLVHMFKEYLPRKGTLIRLKYLNENIDRLSAVCRIKYDLENNSSWWVFWITRSSGIIISEGISHTFDSLLIFFSHEMVFKLPMYFF